MRDLDLRGLPAALIKFLDDNRALKIHEPQIDGERSPRTAYMNPLATEAGRQPAFTLQVTDFSTGDQQSVVLTSDEALQILAINQKPEAFDVCVDIIVEAKVQGRTVRRTTLPPEKIRRD